MAEPRIREIVRQLPENGLKLLLHDPANVRDLLRIAGSGLVDSLDFVRLAFDPTSYVASDYRHVETDLVLTVPFRGRGRSRRPAVLYILIEHQSEPDPLMLLRVLDYMVQVWKAQVRARGPRRRTKAADRLQPILPVVFYTGTRAWASLGHLVDLIEHGDLVRDVTPSWEPLFVNLPALAPAALETPENHFGWLLRLLQERRSRPAEYRELLQRVVAHVEALSSAERLRWLELLSYIHALVYHDREPNEHELLQNLIRDSVQSERNRQEVSTMRQTIADVLREEGRVEGRKEEAVHSRQQTLLRLLRRRFRTLPRSTVQAIEATRDLDQLDKWIDQAADGVSLREMGIAAKS
jgi:hypothetical protein